MTRHLAIGEGPITSLTQIGQPITEVLGGLTSQLEELRAYREKFGPMEELDT